MLVPEPGQPPQALATLSVVDPSPAASRVWEQVYTYSKTVVLEGYTRDGWAWKSSGAWNALIVQSTDGKNKLLGFNKYLKDRQKCAYGRFLLNGTTGIWVVSYIQKPTGNENRMECRIALDLTQIPGCPLSASPPSKQQVKAAPPAAVDSAPRKRSGAGLLGRLVGAQQKTNQHVLAAMAPPPAAASLAIAPTNTGDKASVDVGEPRTATNVLDDFRNDMEQRMMDFDVSAESEMRVKIILAEYIAGLSIEDKERVTMDALKYMVMEAAEEVNEEWITYKEPSEFMDEVTIAVFKEGCAPPEVLEEVNKAELPEEIINQQKHAEQDRQRQMAAENRKQNVALQSAFADDDDVDQVAAALNTNKRDRRTLEDYERERKKGRF